MADDSKNRMNKWDYYFLGVTLLYILWRLKILMAR
jgi:hypothetical protein